MPTRSTELAQDVSDPIEDDSSDRSAVATPVAPNDAALTAPARRRRRRLPEWQVFLLLFVAAFVVRCGYIANTSQFLNKPWEAARAAISLAQEGVLGNVYWSDSGPSAHVAPLYPLMLAPLVHFCGGWNLTTVLLSRLIATAAASAAIGLLPQISAALGWGRKTGIAAAAVLVFIPLHWRHDTISFWEAPYAALVFELVVLTVLRLDRMEGRPKTSGTRLGVLLGIAGLLSPPAFLAGILSSFGAVVTVRNRRSLLFQTIPVALGVAGLMLAPWIWRNARVLGGFVPLRSNFGLELCIGNCDGSNGRYKTTYSRYHPIINKEKRHEYRELGEVAFMKRRQVEGLSWIRQNPSTFLMLSVRRAAIIWFPALSDWRGRVIVSQIKWLANCAISVLSIVAVFGLFSAQSPPRYIVAGAVLGFVGVYTVTHADIRYLYPLFWLNTLLAMGTIAEARRRWRRARTSTTSAP